MEAARRDCPVCGAPDPLISVRRAAVPVLQNRVYASRDEALAAPVAPFALGTCVACGFSYNACFDARLMVYDASYDNHVASAAFADYYRSLAAMLIERFGLKDGTVYDVGCGKGEFLRILCGMAPGIHGVGIDPSCTPIEEGNFRLLQAPFDAALLAGTPRLVVCRHVLEHIDEPRAFMAGLSAAMPDAPLFVEVPDLDWILANGAFWDFCYEHCNYFTRGTLAATLGRAGFAVEAQALSFGGQYQWAIARPAVPHEPDAPAQAALAAVSTYAAAEGARLRALAARADAAGGVALWGMATKGVLLATLLGRDRILGGIDMNAGKQGRFAPASGIEIHPPNFLETLAPGAGVLVMNPNYLDEIAAEVHRIRSDLRLEAA
jgi:SAM-dependent methyltransferase